MPTIYFATSNNEKLLIAQSICKSAGIGLEQVELDVDEIQGEDAEYIARDKARRAYEQLGKPVVVSDDTWDIPALNGFPGAYMKSINHWFQPADFLRLVDGVADRTIILHQYLAYADGTDITVFSSDMRGRILSEARGISKKSPSMTVTALDADNGKTIAEVFETDQIKTTQYERPDDAWHQFTGWFRKNLNS